MSHEARRATEADLVGLVDLLDQLGYPTDPGALAARLAGWTASAERGLFVAVDAGTPVGLVALTITPRLESDASWAQVVALVVDQQHRGDGVGRDLLEHAEQHARRCGCNTVVINSSRTRDNAHSFYRGLGYRDRCGDHAQYVRAPEPRRR